MNKSLSFSDIIDDLVEEKKKDGLTEGQIAKELGIQPPTLTAYKNGDRFPNFGNIMRIADYFGVSLDYLAGRSEYRNDNLRYITGKNLGLTEKAIQSLLEIAEDDSRLAVFNWVIEHGAIFEFVSCISQWIETEVISLLNSHNDNLQELSENDIYELVLELYGKIPFELNIDSIFEVAHRNYEEDTEFGNIYQICHYRKYVVTQIVEEVTESIRAYLIEENFRHYENPRITEALRKEKRKQKQ